MRVETGRSVRRLSQQSGEKWWLRLSGGSEHVIVGSCEFYIYLKVETTREKFRMTLRFESGESS